MEASLWVEEQGHAGKKGVISSWSIVQSKKYLNLIKGVVSLPFSNHYLLPEMGKLWLKPINAWENKMVCNKICKHFSHNQMFKWT